MKKLLVILMVLAFAAPAMADDALDASGSMRVEMYSIDNSDFTDDDDADLKYWDQRFRLQLRMKPADGVSATVRTDITEDSWGKLQGNAGGDGFRPGLAVDSTSGSVDSAGAANGILMVDRAYLSVDKGLVNITAGLNTFNLGHGIVYNNQGQGIQFTIKTPVTIRLGYTKESEGGSNSDDDGLGTEDIDTYFVDLGYKNDMMSINVFYGMFKDETAVEAEPFVFGVYYKGKLGPVNVTAELATFGGEIDSTSTDFVGTQLYGDVSMKLSDMLTVGSHVIYAMGSDETDEIVVPGAIVSFADVVYQDQILPQNGPGTLQPLGLGFSVGPNQGAMGIGPYATFKVLDELTLAAHIIYLASAEDAPDPTVEIDSVLFYGVGASWAMAPKTKLDFGYTAASIEEGDDFVGDPEDYAGFGAILSVSF